MKTTMEIWQKAQSKELEWHIYNQWRADTSAFMAQTNAYFEKMGFRPDQFKSVIDAGCGPRLRSVYFEGAKLYAIDPLADDYESSLTWCDLDKATVYSQPLEDFIPGLHAEFLFSLNCLDHCRDFDAVIANIAQYADEIFLSYDCGEPDPLHPLTIDESTSEQMFEIMGLRIMKKTVTEPWRSGRALNYWLKNEPLKKEIVVPDVKVVKQKRTRRVKK